MKRRNVVRIGVLYILSTWLLLQAGSVLFDVLGLPEWSLRMVFGLALLGFPWRWARPGCSS